MKKMLKRADGSYSQRGLWDNIRANKGSGKKPTKEMLEQEAKIKSKKKMGGPGKPEKATADKTSVKVNPPLPPSYRAISDAKEKLKIAKDLYKANPTKTFKNQVDKFKSSKWLEESKELKFGGPSKKKYQTAGPMDTKTAVGQVFQGKMTASQGQAAIGKTPKPAMTPEQKTEFMSKLKTYGKKTGGKKRMGGKNC